MSVYGNLFDMADVEFPSQYGGSQRAGAAGRVSQEERWAAVSAVPQQREDRLPMEEARAKWSRIYEMFGARSEDSMDEAFAAINLYFLVNGCSPAGKYARKVRTAGGIEIPVDSVVKITGRLEGEIRQFMRADMEKTYNCLKFTPAVRQDQALQDKAERLGVPREKAWLLADWLRDCEYLTGEEAALHTSLSKMLITDANERRTKPVASHRVDREVNGSSVEVTPPDRYSTPAGFGSSTY